MIRYYCSGFDVNDAFGHGLGDMFKNELKDTRSIVYIPGNLDNVRKAKDVYVPAFTKHFKSIGIEFEKRILLSRNIIPSAAKKAVREASFIMLMGGDPFKQKALCEELGIMEELKRFDGIMLGFSAGAMLMSKYIIITPCSEEYPDFHIEQGLNLDDISIYPHNNIDDSEYPDILEVGSEVYLKNDLIKVASAYGEYYLLQDYERDDGLTDVSIIKSSNGKLELYRENAGRIWMATANGIELYDEKYISMKKIVK